ncbi:MAG: hypothetical protein AAF800_06590 [Planctomycetota bacterium]
MPRPQRRPPPPRPLTAISTLLAVAAAVPLGVVGVRHAERAITLARLDHPESAVREAVLNDLYRTVDRQPRHASAAATRIDTIDADHLGPLLAVLRRAEVVDHPVVQDTLARRLDTLPHDAFRIAAAYAASTGPPGIAAAARDASAVRRLQDPAYSQTQRFELIGLLERAGTWRSPPVPPAMILGHRARGLNDPNPALRRAAVRRVGELAVELPEPPVAAIAEALRPSLRDPEASVRHAAVTAWAGLAGLRPPLRDALEPLTGDGDEAVRRWVRRLLRVASGERRVESEVPDDPIGAASDVWSDRLRQFENAPLGRLDHVAFDPAMPHLVRVAAARAARDPEPAWLHDTLRLDGRAAVRDLACVVAAERFDGARLDALIGELLGGFDPDGRASGAVLVGLTGRKLASLRRAVDTERDPAVRVLLRVGLWMSGGDARFEDAQVVSLLGRAGVPDSTVALALLHRGRWREVLDALFRSPPGGSAGLDRRLRAERWAHVLNRYLPPAAPRPDPAAPWPDWVEQREDLRAWHALHRGKPGDSVR